MHGRAWHFLFFFFVAASSNSQQHLIFPSQAKALLRLQRILYYPPSFSPLSSTPVSSFCSLPTTKKFSITCSGGRVKTLSVSGDDPDHILPPAFSSDSLFTTLAEIRYVTSLSLVSLGIHGRLSGKLSRISGLTTLNLSFNHFSGEVPDLSPLSPTLRELDLRSNLLGPSFPSAAASLGRLQNLDLSSNKLSGEIPAGLVCGPRLRFVGIAGNHLVGKLPHCMTSPAITVSDAGNCLLSGDSRSQHRNSYCNEGALAAVLPPAGRNVVKKRESNLGLILGIVGGVLGGVLALGLLLLVVVKRSGDWMMVKDNNGGSDFVKTSPRTPHDTKHMSEAVRMGALGLTPYRVFTAEELEEATNYFDRSNLIAEGPDDQCYRGWIRDGSAVFLRRVKLKQKYTSKRINQLLDATSKLRHRHLVSILGHCFIEDSTNPNLFLVLEHVSNGTLRSHLTEWRKREMLKWPQRVAAVIGVARGIQFLHTVTVPGIMGNNLTTENILLDETLTSKISNYNIPVLAKKKNKLGSENPFSSTDNGDIDSVVGIEEAEKEDIYQLGLILLEVITGKSAESTSHMEEQMHQLRKALDDGPGKLRAFTDSAIRNTFAHDSLRTAIEVALNCLSKDRKERPSIDDILWNLQYSMQVQDGWASSESLNIQS